MNRRRLVAGSNGAAVAITLPTLAMISATGSASPLARSVGNNASWRFQEQRIMKQPPQRKAA
jgi:hypothetical protein